ncbi:TIGR00529 family membrane protein [Thermotoga sp. RQ7]|uniref:TIGR00529 family membrane protein n=1 Tax=Thermotoga sp. RQ7 TaxID=126738 RepID=UPI00118481E9|nr:TIGR00529 family membrane protein [Thermotoga sp. RQ7]
MQLYTFSVVTSLITIVITQRILKKLSLSLLSGVAVLFLILRISSVVEIALRVLTSSSFWSLLSTVFLIYLLSGMMESSGDYRKFSKEMRNIFSKNVDSFVPALIGLMPMPGGALFTAPMVKNSLPDESPLRLAVKNYWFRHTIEFFWPIYPAVVLVSELSGVHVSSVSSKLFPVFVLAFITGWLFFNGMQIPRLSRPGSISNLFVLLPITGTGLMILAFRVPGWLALLLNTAGYTVFRRKFFLSALKSTLRKWDVFVVLFLVYCYKVAIDTMNVGEKIAHEFLEWHISPFLLLFFLPFVSGVSTGITQAAVGISLPVVLSMFSKEYAIYTYMFAVGGVILSPVHLCVVLSAKFFRVDVFEILRRVFFPLALTLVFGALILGVIT